MSRFILSETTKLGFIGIGVMGNSMAGHLFAKRPNPLIIYNRTRSKCEALEAKGVRVASSVAEVAQNADVVFLMTSMPEDVLQVVEDQKEGLVANFGDLTVPRVIVDMSTSPPSQTKEMADRLAKLGNISFVDAPVSGGDIGARNGTLSIMYGGSDEVLDQIRPLFECFGSKITHCGDTASGQSTKMVNQILIATNMIGVCEALIFAHRSGLDVNRALEAVSAGAAASWSLSNLAPRIVRRDFAPGFYVAHFVKDLGIALAEARRMKLSLPGLALAQQLYIALQGRLFMYMQREAHTWTPVGLMQLKAATTWARKHWLSRSNG